MATERIGALGWVAGHGLLWTGNNGDFLHISRINSGRGRSVVTAADAQDLCSHLDLAYGKGRVVWLGSFSTDAEFEHAFKQFKRKHGLED